LPLLVELGVALEVRLLLTRGVVEYVEWVVVNHKGNCNTIQQGVATDGEMHNESSLKKKGSMNPLALRFFMRLSVLMFLLQVV
jgi:hypothetical protein